MGLMNNGSRLYWPDLVEGSAHALLPGQWNGQRAWAKFIEPQGESAVMQTAANPPGHYQCAWNPPIKAGEMAMRTQGDGVLAANLYPSRSMSIDLTGSGDLDATAALVISMLLAMSGSGGLSASIVGRSDMAINLTGSGDLDAAMSGIASMAVDLLGSGDLDATIAAYGNMEIDIVVTGTGLSTANVGQAVWAALAAMNNVPGTMGEKLNGAGSAGNPWTEVIDGLTAAQLMSIIAAALAGKTSGQPGAPVFRSVNDAADRIAATVDADGNRTSVTVTP